MEISARAGAVYASQAVGLFSRTAHSGTISLSLTVSVPLQALHSKDLKTLGAQKAISMYGKACVGAAASGLRWLAARRKELHGSGMRTR